MEDRQTAVGDRAQEAAQTTREQASNVADTAKQQASDVAQQAKQQAQNVAQQVQADLKGRANAEAGKLAQTLHDTSKRLHAMADAGDDNSVATSLVREGAHRSERLASTLEHGGVDGAVAEVRSFARRNPGSFLLGAAAAGFFAGRLARHLSSNDGSGGEPFRTSSTPVTSRTYSDIRSTPQFTGGAAPEYDPYAEDTP
jgi:hypothetical protein